NKISFDGRETLFFCQIGFFIINVALAEFFIIINFKNIYLSILNFAILFIIDDFKIINDYSDGMKKVLITHYMRITVFNLIILITAIVLLINTKQYFVLISYLVLFAILCRYYIKNSSKIGYAYSKIYY